MALLFAASASAPHLAIALNFWLRGFSRSGVRNRCLRHVDVSELSSSDAHEGSPFAASSPRRLIDKEKDGRSVEDRRVRA